MNNMEDVRPNLFEITINGTAVQVFMQSRVRWYRLTALFRALEFPEVNSGCLPSKVGNLFSDSGKFQKYEDAWYGTLEGLSLFANYLQEYQYSSSTSRRNRTIARTRHIILQQWLSSERAHIDGLPLDDGPMCNVPPSEKAPACGNNSPMLLNEPEISELSPISKSVTVSKTGDIPFDAASWVRSIRGSLVPDGEPARMMVATLMERTGLLCDMFGIDPNAPRDEKLAWIIWLILFCAYEPVDSPDEVVREIRQHRPMTDKDYEVINDVMRGEELLWRNMRTHYVGNLVKAAMLE